MSTLLRTRRLGSPIQGSGENRGSDQVDTTTLSFINGVVLQTVQNELQVLNQPRTDFGDIRANTVTATTKVIAPSLQFGVGGSNLVFQNGVFAIVNQGVSPGDAGYLAPFSVSSLFVADGIVSNKIVPFSDGTGTGILVVDSSGVSNRDAKGRRLLATEYVDAPLITTDKLECDTLQLINGGRWAVGASFPFTPNAGDRWLETSGGVPVYGWWWSWSGSYWLSPEMRRSLSFDNVSATSRVYFECDQGLDYFFKSLLLNGFVVTTNNGTSNWSAQIERVNNTATVTAVGSAASSSAQSADSGFAVSTAISTHVDVSAVNARQFRVLLTKNNTPGNFFGSATAIFNYARP